MKATIGERIRAVLEKYPEIKRRRAQLNAIGYLFKRDKNVTIRWTTTDKITGLSTNLNTHMQMKSLSEYLYDPTFEKRLGDGVKLPLVMKAFENP